MNTIMSRKGEEDAAEEISATNRVEIREILRARESETYEPRCDDHFILPGRTLPGWEDTSPQRRIWPVTPDIA
jgi:hypothetical protein